MKVFQFKVGDRVVYIKEGSRYFGLKATVLGPTISGKAISLKWDEHKLIGSFITSSGEDPLDLTLVEVFNFPLYQALN